MYRYFIIFSAKKLHWVMEEKGESWTDRQFYDVILLQHVFLFLKEEENVIDPDQVIFVRDKDAMQACKYDSTFA
jgi:hypothetical protein